MNEDCMKCTKCWEVHIIDDLLRRMRRIEKMLDLLGNVALYDPSCLTNQKIEYERLLNQLHEELWREEDE